MKKCKNRNRKQFKKSRKSKKKAQRSSMSLKHKLRMKYRNMNDDEVVAAATDRQFNWANKNLKIEPDKSCWELAYDSEFTTEQVLGITPLTKKQVREWNTGYVRKGIATAKQDPIVMKKELIKDYELPSWNACYFNTLLYAACNKVEEPNAQYTIVEGYFLAIDQIHGRRHKYDLVHHSMLEVKNAVGRIHKIDFTYRDAAPILVHRKTGTQKQWKKFVEDGYGPKVASAGSSREQDYIKYRPLIDAELERRFKANLLTAEQVIAVMDYYEEMMTGIKHRKAQLANVLRGGEGVKPPYKLVSDMVQKEEVSV
jgi:hypothetical protein